MNRHSLTLLAAAALAVATAHADEGMWMPKQLPQIAKPLKAGGLALDPAKLNDLTAFPMGAVVSLGGCTASFVSPQGLVVTNHHCAYGSIQYNSKPDRDLLKNGFYATTLADELPAAPGSRILVTVDMKDVSTDILNAKTLALTGKARTDAIEATEKQLVAACEADAGHRCNVYPFFGGLQYQLIKQLEIRDVRLVHAPATGVGLFGGDADNWIWPRHTGDYSFYRAYVGPDGKPADFSKDNKPYAPKHHLKVASPKTSPLNDGDFVMVAGYPGRTNRHRLPTEVDFAFGWQQPAQTKAMGESIAIIKAETAGRRDGEIKMAARMQGLQNYYKNLEGQQQSYDGSDILARKQAQFAKLKAWVGADAKRQARYGADLAATESLIAERERITRAELLMNFMSPALLNSARQLYEIAEQRAKPDAERKSGYQDRDLPRLKAAQQSLDRRYDEPTDKRLVAHFLAQYLAQPADTLNAAWLNTLGLKAGQDEASIRTQIDKLYAGSKLSDTAARMAWLDKDVAAFKASDDAFIKAAVALYADDERRENRDKELAGKLQKAYAGVQQALIDYHASRGEAVYPDANGTLRISFGKVQGRTPGADGSNWTAFTTLNGIVAKHKGPDEAGGEFNAPAEQLAAIKARNFGDYGVKSLNSVPVNFLSTLDTTGGNSGSPVLNKKAELVGLLFDGTLDAVISDWDFNPKMVRSICVDSRYMLWQMSTVDKTTRLLQEMGVK
ncbi:S46 family peptidase [Pelomonas sp. Root1444]|uniref:S46 family peptidase n=1 Tax=Pelomonas sp. Root1444 TaxID=1736464 RepID=UPI000702CBE3|nr:S46 family peptidase [Pelomonas sp. Root1444]KQY88588.1 dipeptidyl-peptidase 7 [Pelomonas sp. Root1444]